MAQIINTPSLNNMAYMGNPYNPAALTQPQNTTLYVGNLDKDIDAQKLYDYFSVISKPDNLQKIDLKKEITGESRGFAYVTFTNHAAAARAKQVFNHTKIKENTISVAFVRRANDLNPNANLFFRNLNRQMTSKELEELCATYGTILSCKLSYDEYGHSFGYGYVQFEKDSAAGECREALNKKNIQESVIEVDVFKPKQQRASLNQKCNLYLKQFPDSWGESQVDDFITNHVGKGRAIQSKAIAKDQKIGKYYAFLAFNSADHAQEAIKQFTEHEFTGEPIRLYIDFAQSKEQRKKILKDKHKLASNETNLFIKSLAPSVTESALKSVFEKEFGEVTSVCVKTHELGKHGGPATNEKKSLQFGFINFKRQEDATKAYKEGKKNPEVLALIDPSHYTNVDFIYYHQSKLIRSQYNKIQLKNKKANQSLQQNMKFYQQYFEKMMKMQQPQQPKPYQKRNNAPQQNKRGSNEMYGANNMNQLNQMMFQQMQMNPQMMAVYQAQQVVLLNSGPSHATVLQPTTTNHEHADCRHSTAERVHQSTTSSNSSTNSHCNRRSKGYRMAEDQCEQV